MVLRVKDEVRTRLPVIIGEIKKYLKTNTERILCALKTGRMLKM